MSDPVFDPEVYGEPVYTDALIDPEVYGEVPLAEDGGAATTFTLDAVLFIPSFTLDAVIGVSTFVLDAVVRRGVTSSFTLDSLVFGDVWVVTFSLDAVITQARTRHPRNNEAHFGIDLATVLELASQLDIHPAGTTVQDVLVDIEQRITELENG
jgi:hypothetical protein